MDYVWNYRPVRLSTFFRPALDPSRREILPALSGKKSQCPVAEKTAVTAGGKGCAGGQWNKYCTSPTRQSKNLRQNYYIFSENVKSKDKSLRMMKQRPNLSSLRENLFAKFNATYLSTKKPPPATRKLPLLSVEKVVKKPKNAVSLENDLSEFVLVETIGIGCYAEVKLARWKSLDKPCAIKMVNKKVAVRFRQVHKLLREHQLLSKIKHPFVVQ
eukprot:TRINITY_DN2633_c0_g2_i4.p1 TRINITY_DN2633_c0_g2~~TRINITY_DN2633_c0_g2_i4.p1  ORF type:complete len:215 (+),score=54.48 TRINITY_DN2633_c0_g2_i4:137-781(+)